MTWNVLWSSRSIRQLKKLDKKQARKIRDAVLEITDNPFVAVRKLSDSVFFRMRVGNYRIIMDLQQGTMIIFVVEVDHRRRVYD
ncbi:type II toxin-antitoxin system RelE/ParE family toxin [Nitrosopumilus sp.]|uniref:type II toxin-antitoxin system RelE family toxin n=1 Tax=Nitrosopumilus sp. TaxID=2024843 RepID=UPI00292DC112|nr:type II toxin-antitoxin system RelE/ParE family toxin [Nitrosopumilus sp.]